MANTATTVTVLLIFLYSNARTRSHTISSDVKFCKANPPKLAPPDSVSADTGPLMTASLVEFVCGQPPMLELLNSGEFNYYLPIPSTVKFLCETSNKTDCTNITLTYGALTAHPVEILNEHQTLTTLDFNDLMNTMWLVCRCSIVDVPHLAVAFVLTGYKPSVDNFKCVYRDFETVTCSWDSQAKEASWTICHHHENTKTCTVKMNTNTFMMNWANLNSTFTVKINGSNKFGNIDVAPTDLFTVDKVQLSAPNASVDESVGSREVRLVWNTECQRSEQYRAFCQSSAIAYQIAATIIERMTPDMQNIPAAYRTVTVHGESKLIENSNKNENGSHIIISVKGLLPFTHYNLTLRQAAQGSLLWSEPTTIYATTAEEVPSSGPRLNENGFSLNGRCEKGRRVSIFWQEQDVHNGANGEIIAYNVWNISRQAKDRQATVCLPMEKTVVPIFTDNTKGKSKNASLITIPAAKQIADLPSCLVRARTVRHRINKVFIDWSLLAKHLHSAHVAGPSYTAFWCKHKDNITCQEELHWQEVEKEHTAVELTLKLESTRYRYGISVSYNGDRSGVIWAHNIFGRSSPEPKDVELAVASYNDTHSQVLVSPRHANKIAMIQSVDLHVCLDHENGSKKICKTYPSVTSNCKTVLHIPLENGNFYSFWLSMTYTDQPGMVNSESILFRMDSAQEGQNMQLFDILIAVGVGAMLVCIAVLAYYIHRKRRQGTRVNSTENC